MAIWNRHGPIIAQNILLQGLQYTACHPIVSPALSSEKFIRVASMYISRTINRNLLMDDFS
jgi:hypothetical protein